MGNIVLNKKQMPFDATKQIASNNFRRNICLLAFLSSVLAGAVSYLSGILSGPIGTSLGFSNGDLAFIALINIALIVGNFVGSGLINVLIRRFTCRGTIIIASIVAFGASILLAIDGLAIITPNVHSVNVAAAVIFAIGVFFSGTAFGALNNTAIFLVIGMFRVVRKDNKWVNITQGAFGIFVSIFGFLSAIIVGAISPNSWYVVYFIIVVICLALIGLGYFLKTGETRNNLLKFMSGSKKEVAKEKAVSKLKLKKLNPLEMQSQKIITIGVLMAAFCLWLYMMIENTQTFWYGQYLANLNVFKGHNPGVYSAIFIALFWTGITVGRLTIRTIAQRISDRNLIFVMAPVVLIGLVLMATTYTMRNSISITGFVVQGCFGSLIIGSGMSVLYPTILNFGLKQSVKSHTLNQAIIADTGIVGAALANIIFFAIAYGAGKTELSYSIPLFYAPGILCILLGLVFATTIWRLKSVEGRYITRAKGSIGENIRVLQKYRMLRREFKQ